MKGYLEPGRDKISLEWREDKLVTKNFAADSTFYENQSKSQRQSGVKETENTHRALNTWCGRPRQSESETLAGDCTEGHGL